MPFWKKKKHEPEQKEDPRIEAIYELYELAFRPGPLKYLFVIPVDTECINSLKEWIPAQRERIKDLELKIQILRDDNLALREKLSILKLEHKNRIGKARAEVQKVQKRLKEIPGEIAKELEDKEDERTCSL